MDKIEYIGSELELFKDAKNWKDYWFSIIDPYIGKRILDVGAGIGATAKMFQKKNIDHYLAIDTDQSNIEAIKDSNISKKINGTFGCICGDISSVDSDQLFDTILYIDVLEHIPNDCSELELAYNHLLPGGRIIVLSPAHQWLYSPFDDSVGHCRRYSKKTLTSVKPKKSTIDMMDYIDSVGVIASMSNRLVLRSKYPTKEQIKIWDDYMIPISVYLDRAIRFRVGKSIIAIFTK